QSYPGGNVLLCFPPCWDTTPFQGVRCCFPELSPGGFRTYPHLYKTELCHRFADSGCCKYGERCQFAHGLHELRLLPRHPKYKTEYCRTFHSLGFCPYENRCHFIHDEGERRMPVPRQVPWYSRAHSPASDGVCSSSASDSPEHFPGSPAHPSSEPAASANNNTSPAAGAASCCLYNNNTSPASGATSCCLYNNNTSPAAGANSCCVYNNNTSPAAGATSANNNTSPAAGVASCCLYNNNTSPAGSAATSCCVYNNNTSPTGSAATSCCVYNNNTSPAGSTAMSCCLHNNNTSPAGSTSDCHHHNNNTSPAGGTGIAKLLVPLAQKLRALEGSGPTSPPRSSGLRSPREVDCPPGHRSPSLDARAHPAGASEAPAALDSAKRLPVFSRISTRSI
ncbi:mRNA decay activator protein ZFP36L2-like, partial [Chiloscyllium plagiosum]|uniref:mRNA decay activator protein ZFP36L2-like n=1 Tax=Chiloscyllium plagiosum TaxID=36176 RepID=UPI001CB7C24C